jgi:hypothetical protein
VILMRKQTLLLAIALFTLTVSAFVSVAPASAQDGGWSEGGCFWDQRGEWYCPPGHTTASDEWAAIAYAFDSAMSSGSSYGQGSQESAEKLALKYCSSVVSGCKILLWVRNTCAALSISRPDGVYGYDNDPDRSRAEAKALARCRGAKGKNCVVQASPCASDPGSTLSAYSQTTRANPYVGTWNLNVAKSEFGRTPALYIPKSETLVILAGNSDYDRKFTLRGIGANGKPFQMSFDGAADDKPHPTPGGGSLAYLRSGGWVVRDKNGSVVETGTSSISDDGKTLANTAVHKTPGGDVNTTLIYDKVN